MNKSKVSHNTSSIKICSKSSSSKNNKEYKKVNVTSDREHDLHAAHRVHNVDFIFVCLNYSTLCTEYGIQKNFP